MTAYRIRMTAEAERDLQSFYDAISARASANMARGYVNRIIGYLSGFDQFPKRGSLRNHIRKGLRVVGFERRVAIAFIVETEEVVVVRILYGGKKLELPGGVGI